MTARAALVAAACALAGCAAPATWRPLAPLPDPTGYAGMFSADIGGALYAGGGSQFADRPLWLNGTKVFTDRIFVLRDLDGAWRELPVRLPRPAGHFAAAAADDVVILAGGADNRGAIADVFELHGRGDDLGFRALPSLPQPLAYAGAAIAHGRIYVAGGRTDLNVKVASAAMWSLAVARDAREANWRREPDLPVGITLAAMAASADSLYLVGGVEYAADGTSLPSARAFRFDLNSRAWSELPPMPQPRIGPAGPCPWLGDRLWVVGGYAKIFPGAPRDHPGFDAQTYLYDPSRQAWENGPVIPHALPQERDATGDPGPAPMLVAPCAVWQGHAVFVGGEVRSSVRTPAVLAWPLPRR